MIAVGRRSIAGAAAAGAVAINVAVLVALGSRAGGDTPRYLDGAARMLAGVPLTERQSAYSGYIWVLAALFRLHLPAASIYAVHVAASAAAAAALTAAGARLAGRRGAIAAALAWVLLIDVHRWNAYLLTDGLFISAVAIAAGLAFAATNGAAAFTAMAAACLVALVRINGLPYAIILVSGVALRRSRRAVLLGIVLLLALLLAPTARALRALGSGTGEAFSSEVLLDDLTRGEVIWHTTAIPMPRPAPASGHLARDLFRYVTAHPISVAGLYGLRLGHYLFGFNPRYSTKHLVAVVLQWILIYGGCVLGLRALQRRGQLAEAWPALIWIAQGFVVMITVGDFDGRYSLYAIGGLIPVFAAGAASVIDE
jgi:hypothetical protein